MKRYIYIIIFCTLLPALMNAQSIGLAKKQMDKYNFAGAVETLKKAVEKEKTRNAALPLLAECYRLQHDIVKARSTYAQVVALPDVKPEFIFFYAQALQSTGNYTKAREMFQQYSEKVPSDPRGKLYMAHCDSVLGPWKKLTPQYEAKLVDNINTSQSDFGPAFYRGQLIFASDFTRNTGEGKKYGWTGRGYLNIMKARPEIDDNYWDDMGYASPFDSKFNQKYHDGPAAFSADENSIYFTRSFYGKAKLKGMFKTNLLKIYYATKTDDGSWGEVKPFFLNSDDYSVGHPTLSNDGQTLYFVSDMPGGQGGTDIWMCKSEADAWGPAINLGKTVNSPENEMFPTIESNGVLYFASDGHPGYGALDIFKTAFEKGTWTTPENLHPPINSSFDDFAFAFAPDNNGFFSSNRLFGVGSDDIYSFRIAPKPLNLPLRALPAYISGLVRDKTTMKPMSGSLVFMYNPSTGLVKVLRTDTAGMYSAVITEPEEYIIKAMMPNHIAECIPFTMTVVLPGKTSIVPSDLVLDKLEMNKTFRIENIYYNFDKYNIREDAKVELDKLVSIMNENAITVELGSHTDSRGSIEYNDKLSQNRAESVVKYIVSAGIDKNRIKAKGYGEHQLTNQCTDGVECTSEEHQANRRTEFKVTSFTKKAVNSEYDLSKFGTGDEIPVYMFEQNFFANCMRDNLKALANTARDTAAVSAEKETKVQPAAKKDGEVPVQTHPGTVFYKVNLYALSVEKSLKDDKFKGLDNIQMYKEDGKFKYTAGLFSSYKGALEYKKKLIELGYEDAFVVAFSNGKRIPVSTSGR